MSRLLRLDGDVESTTPAARTYHGSTSGRRGRGGQRRLTHPLPLHLLRRRLYVELGPALPPAAAAILDPIPLVLPGSEADDADGAATTVSITVSPASSARSSPRRRRSSAGRGWSSAGYGLVAAQRGRWY